jgi:hypothetical protein
MCFHRYAWSSSSSPTYYLVPGTERLMLLLLLLCWCSYSSNSKYFQDGNWKQPSQDTQYVRIADVKSRVSERNTPTPNTRRTHAAAIRATERGYIYLSHVVAIIATFTPEKVKDGCGTSTR